MKKDMLKGYVVGALSTLLVAGVAVPAVAQNIDVMRGVKIFVDDMQLYGAEGFIYDGTTYLPVRKISEALDKPVAWDGKTKSVYIGKHESSTPAVMLADMECCYEEDYGFRKGSSIKDNRGNSYHDAIRLVNSGFGGNEGVEEYEINGKYGKMKGRLTLESKSSLKSSWMKIYGDGKLLYTSPDMKGGATPVDFEVDLTGVLTLRIEGHRENGNSPALYLVNTGLYQ